MVQEFKSSNGSGFLFFLFTFYEHVQKHDESFPMFSYELKYVFNILLFHGNKFLSFRPDGPLLDGRGAHRAGLVFTHRHLQECRCCFQLRCW